MTSREPRGCLGLNCEYPSSTSFLNLFLGLMSLFSAGSSLRSISDFLLEAWPYPLSSENTNLTTTSMLMIHRSIHLPTSDLANVLQNKSSACFPVVPLQTFCSPPSSAQLKESHYNQFPLPPAFPLITLSNTVSPLVTQV